MDRGLDSLCNQHSGLLIAVLLPEKTKLKIFRCIDSALKSAKEMNTRKN